MLTRAVILGSICGLILLYMISQTQTPPSVTPQEFLENFQRYEGRYLSLEGRISWINLLGSGGAILKLDNVTVFLEDSSGIKLNLGDLVRILGRAQRYKGKPELVAESSRSINILERAAGPSMAQVAANPGLFLGSKLVLEGMLKRDESGYWLSSQGVELRIVPQDPKAISRYLGSWIRLEGFLSYNRSRAWYELIGAEIA